MSPSILKLVKEAVGSKEEPTPWPAALIIGLVAVLVVGISVFSSILAGRKHAALAHKLDVLENDNRQKKKLFDKLEESKQEREEIAKQVETLEAKKQGIQNKLQKLEDKREDFKAKLATVTDWDDVA